MTFGLAELRVQGFRSARDFAPWVAGADLEPLVEAGLLQSRGLDEAGQERYGWHDLTRLYVSQEQVGTDIFLYMAWERFLDR